MSEHDDDPTLPAEIPIESRIVEASDGGELDLNGLVSRLAIARRNKADAEESARQKTMVEQAVIAYWADQEQLIRDTLQLEMSVTGRKTVDLYGLEVRLENRTETKITDPGDALLYLQRTISMGDWHKYVRPTMDEKAVKELHKLTPVDGIETTVKQTLSVRAGTPVAQSPDDTHFTDYQQEAATAIDADGLDF